jgi:flagellar L-ring protein precursor FlgH
MKRVEPSTGPGTSGRVGIWPVAIAMLLAALLARAQSSIPVNQNGVNHNGVNPADPNPGYTPTENRLMSKVTPIRPSPADVALSAYIARVHTDYQPEEPTPGSLWIPNGRLTTFSADFRAHRLHDVISVVVSESLTAETDGAVKNQRASSMSSAISSLFGTLGANNRLQNLLNTNAASALTAQGQSVSNSSLSTTLGGEVVDVLPNGMLVIQAVRQVTFSQQTQTIRLRGVVRLEDINVLNQVQSTAITNLELEVLGKGIINDYTYRPNLIVRLVQRLLVF